MARNLMMASGNPVMVVKTIFSKLMLCHSGVVACYSAIYCTRIVLVLAPVNERCSLDWPVGTVLTLRSAVLW